VQTQLAIRGVSVSACGGIDFNVGAGITRAHQMIQDLRSHVPNQPDYLSLRWPLRVVVYHFTSISTAHLTTFRSDVKWWLGEEQVIKRSTPA